MSPVTSPIILSGLLDVFVLFSGGGGVVGRMEGAIPTLFQPKYSGIMLQ